MTTKQGTKRTTAADVAAAVKLGAIAPDAEMVSVEDAQEAIRSAEHAAAITAAAAVETLPLSSTEHACGIAGCRHGAAHGAMTQPDRQVKLSCPNCNAVARMTERALATAGTITCGDGGTFARAARRTYVRKAR